MPGSKPVLLPWPMTNREAAGYMAIMFGIVIGTTIAVTWAAFSLIEPSPWRIVPTLLWFVLIRLVLAPAIVRSLRPRDVAAREAHLAAE